MTATESTLVMIKPDARERNLVELITNELLTKDLIFSQVGHANFNLDIIKEFYRWDVIKCPETVYGYLCTTPIPLWIVCGTSVIEKTMEIKWRLRRTMCDGSHRNLMHCSSSNENFTWEYGVLTKHHMITTSVEVS